MRTRRKKIVVGETERGRKQEKCAITGEGCDDG